ncbi:uncharacterized protein [Hetaerina americana]|uniref:uncharacterized protein n=1 Tax=Hetaerina americana TaxID=62018 RepID=UPI003A7F23A4
MNGALSQVFGGLMKRLPLACHYQICSVRTDSRRSIRRNKKPPSNPGVQNKLKVLEMEYPDIEELHDEEINLEEFESDLMQVNVSHKNYEREKKAAADSLAYAITKSKHFKPPKLPNLLMWSEKEQIRNLHQLDAIEWSPEKLAQHFPATAEIVMKLIKSRWEPRSGADIERHDRSVQRNWSDLLKGKFNLDPEVKRHFLTFSARQMNFPEGSSSDIEKIVIHNKPRGTTEFSDIVRSSNEKSSGGDKPLEANIAELAPLHLNRKSSDAKSDCFVMPSRSRNSRDLLPLKEYKEKVLSVMDELEEDDELARKYYDHLKKGTVEGKGEVKDLQIGEGIQIEEKPLQSTSKTLKKYKSEEGRHNLLPQELDVYLKAEQYKMKIKIPKEKFDSSAIYKVKDCFYDADGKFLYRVPGMS